MAQQGFNTLGLGTGALAWQLQQFFKPWRSQSFL
jgi:hypothetical protein